MRSRIHPHSISSMSLLLAGLIFVVGCGYPRVTSDAVELTKVIDTVCNLRSAAQIDPARGLVLERYQEGAISEEERQMLETILNVAEKGQWESAAARCRRLLEAQTTPNPL